MSDRFELMMAARKMALDGPPKNVAGLDSNV